jgi:hypothetical protein
LNEANGFATSKVEAGGYATFHNDVHNNDVHNNDVHNNLVNLKNSR